MPRKRANTWEEAPASRRANPLRGAWRTLRSVLIVLSILYVAGWVIGRTEGFRSLVAQRLEKLLGMPVKIESASLNLRYGLTLRHLVTEGTRRENSPGIRAQRIEIEWRWGDLLRRGRPGIKRLVLEKPVIVFEQQDSGGWSPDPLAPMSDFLARQMQFSFAPRNAAANVPVSEGAGTNAPSVVTQRRSKNELTATLGHLDMAVAIQRGQVVWWTGDAAPAASVEGVTFQATPVQLPDRALTHYVLKVERAASAQGAAIRDLVIELLDTGDQQVILRFLGEHLAPARALDKPAMPASL